MSKDVAYLNALTCTYVIEVINMLKLGVNGKVRSVQQYPVMRSQKKKNRTGVVSQRRASSHRDVSIPEQWDVVGVWV
jgi:hypothetical protein